MTASSSSERFQKLPVPGAVLINEVHRNIVTWHCDVMMTKCGDTTVVGQADTTAVHC